MISIYKKDLRSFFTSIWGYMYLAVFPVFGGIYFSRWFSPFGSSIDGDAFSNIGVAMIVLIPLISMNSFALEHKNGTDRLLLSGPVSMRAIVLSKLLAVFTFFLIAIVCAIAIPLIQMAALGCPLGDALGGALGLVLFGAAAISMGVFISSLSAHPLRAAIVAAIAMLILWMVERVLPNVPNTFLYSFLSLFSLFGRLGDFQYGYIRLSSVAYMLSFMAIFYLLTCKSIDLRRENRL